MSDVILHTDGDPCCECSRCTDQEEQSAQDLIDEITGDDEDDY